MTIGEIISALVLCASSLADDRDDLLMAKDVYDVKAKDGYIEVHFVDGNTTDIRIYPDGRKDYLNHEE